MAQAGPFSTAETNREPWVLIVGLIATVGAMALSSRYMTNKAIEREFGPAESDAERE